MTNKSWRLLTQEDMKESPEGLSEFEKLVLVCSAARDFLYQEKSQEATNNCDVNSVICLAPDKIYDKSWGKKPIQEDGGLVSKDAFLSGSVSCISREDLFKGSKTNRGETSSARFCKSKRSVVDHDYLGDKKAVKWKDFDWYSLNKKSDRVCEEVFHGRRERKRSREYFDSCEDDQDFEYFEKKRKKGKEKMRNTRKNFDLCEDDQDFEYLEKKKKKEKVKVRNKFVAKGEVDNVSPMPVEFKNRIQEMRGTDIKLVIQKHLFPTDLASSQDRFSIPKKQIREDFLRDEENIILGQHTADGKHLVPIMVPLIEPNLEMTQINFRKWDSNSSYVLSDPWNGIRYRNGLQVGMKMQLWSFRVDGGLNFALVKVSRDNNQAHETNIANASDQLNRTNIGKGEGSSTGSAYRS